MSDLLKSRLPLLKRAAPVLLALLLLYALAGFALLPGLLKSYMVRELSSMLHRTVSVERVAVNPFVLSVTLTGIRISERGGSGRFIACDELYLNLEAISIIRRGLILKELKLVNPALTITRGADLKYNFADLLEADTPKPAEPSSPLRFSLNNIQLSGGSIDFDDQPKKTLHKVRDMNFQVPFLSNLPYYADAYVKPSFEATINDRKVSFTGITKPFKESLETTFDINIKEMDLPYYLAYVPFEMAYRIESALLSSKAVLTFVQSNKDNPSVTLSGEIDFNKIRIVSPDGSLLIDIPGLGFVIGSAELVSRKVRITRIMIESPELNVLRKKDGRLNLSAFVSTDTAPETKKEAEGPELVLDIDEINCINAKVGYSDNFLQSPFATVLNPVNFIVNNFSTVRDKKAAARLSMSSGFGESISIEGEFSVEPLSASGMFKLLHMPLKKYAPYYADRLEFAVEDALMDVSTKYQYEKGPSEASAVTRLAELGMLLKNVRLRRHAEAEDFLRVPEIQFEGGSLDTALRELVFGSIATRNGSVSVLRAKDGSLNLAKLIKEPVPAAAAPVKVSAPSAPAEKEWSFTLKSLGLQNYSLRYADNFPADTVELAATRIMVNAAGLSTKKGLQGNVSGSLLLGKAGSFSASGPLTLKPFSAAMTVSLKNAELYSLQSYLTDRTNLIIADGRLSGSGRLSLAASDNGVMKGGYTGDVSVSALRAVDTINTDELVSWNNLYVGGINAAFNPFSLYIKDVAVSELYARLIINPDGSLNLQEVMKQQPASAGQPEPAAVSAPKPAAAGAGTHGKSGPVKVDTVTMQGGTVQFSDYYIKPNYSARMVELGGRVTGMSSEEQVMADVDLRGKLDNYAPLEIKGRINPLREDLFVDIKAKFSDMDLSPVTPYSARYLGYKIEKGKLSLDLNYRILKKKLDADNKIFLDQFTFGEKVESPDATPLPVKLAVSLLKNRRGEIDLDLPLTGSIDDPKFSIGRVIIKILVNLLVKAATSPFALLSAFGGGEELSFVEFENGSAALGEQGTKKLDTLVKALNDRPALKLEIEGHVDSEKDAQGLAKMLFERKLKAQKLKDLAKKGRPSLPIDEISIEQPEYPVYLKLAYKEEKFPKPRNFLGIAKDLPVPEMEKLIRAHIIVSEDDLRQLARERALQVEEFILKTGKVERERIFIVEPRTLQPEKKEKLRDSRVDFRLK